MPEHAPEVLARAGVFDNVPAEGLAWLAGQGRVRSFRAGARLMRQGEAGESLYVLLGGRVRVERAHPQLLEPVALAELWAGETVGEMAVLDGGPRSASVVALERTTALELGAETLARLILRHPRVGRHLLRLLSRRLRRTDELLGRLRERGES